MNTNQVKGQVKEAAGTAQRKFGEAVDSPSQQAKGLGREVEGKAQKAVGNAQEAAEDAADDLDRNPPAPRPPPARVFSLGPGFTEDVSTPGAAHGQPEVVPAARAGTAGSAPPTPGAARPGR